MINGDQGDPNAAQFKAGAHRVLDGKVDIAAEYDTPAGWPTGANAGGRAPRSPRSAPRTIAAVYSANDGMAAGIITALQAAGMTRSRRSAARTPQLDGVQRVVAGTQAFTIYKPYTHGGRHRRRDGVALATASRSARSLPTKANNGTSACRPTSIPTIVLTKDNVQHDRGGRRAYTVADICTASTRPPAPRSA